jgi:hypothetical protein
MSKRILNGEIKIVYWHVQDGALYAPAYVEGAKPDGSNHVPNFVRYKVPAKITINAADLDGVISLLDILDERAEMVE